MTGKGLTIGKVAAPSGVGAKAIRFYERAGVLPAATRAENRYRVYASDAVDVVGVDALLGRDEYRSNLHFRFPR